MRLHVAFLSVLLLMPFVAADDGGSGGDAPDEWIDALPAASPTEGRLDVAAGDAGDWYRYAAVPGKGVAVRLETNAEFFRIEVRTPTGAILHAGDYWNWLGGWGYIGVESFSPPEAILVGILPYEGHSGDYRIMVSHFDVLDFAITALSVEPLPVVAAGVPVAPGTQQLVRVTIENRASAAATTQVHLEAVHETTLNTRHVGFASTGEIPAGASRVLEFVWDATGEVGDIRLDASASTYHDRDPWNNLRSVRAHVLVANSGLSADLLNARARQGVAGNVVEVESQYHVGWRYQQVCAEGVAEIRSGTAYPSPTIIVGPRPC